MFSSQMYCQISRSVQLERAGRRVYFQIPLLPDRYITTPQLWTLIFRPSDGNGHERQNTFFARDFPHRAVRRRNAASKPYFVQRLL